MHSRTSSFSSMPAMYNKEPPGPLRPSNWNKLKDGVKSTHDYENKSFTEFFLEETTLHGVRYVLGANSIFRRVTWLVLLVVGTFLMVTQILTQVQLYQANPITTNIHIDYPTSMWFPQIAICNINQFRISKSNKELYNFIRSVYTTENRRGSKRNLTNIEFPFNESKPFLREMSHQIEDMLIDCEYPNGEECTSSNFTAILTDYGICYTINHQPENAITVNSAGSETSLKIVLNIENYESMHGPGRTNGLKLVTFNHTNVPLISYDAIDLAPGYQTQLGMEFTEATKLNVIYGGSCIAAQASTHFSEDQYSVQTCRLDKIYNKIKKACNCTPYNSVPVGGVDNPLPPCTPLQHFTCVIKNNKLNGDDVAECRENCTSIKYTMSQGFSVLRVEMLRTLASRERSTNVTISKFMKDRFSVAWESRIRNEEYERSKFQAITDGLQLAQQAIEDKKVVKRKELHDHLFDRLQKISTCFTTIVTNDNYNVVLNTIGGPPGPQTASVFDTSPNSNLMELVKTHPFTDKQFEEVAKVSTTKILGSLAKILLSTNEYKQVSSELNGIAAVQNYFTNTVGPLYKEMEKFLEPFVESNIKQMEQAFLSDEKYTTLYRTLESFIDGKTTKFEFATIILEDIGEMYNTFMQNAFDEFGLQLHSYRKALKSIDKWPDLAKFQNGSESFQTFMNFLVFVPSENYYTGCSTGQAKYLMCIDILNGTNIWDPITGNVVNQFKNPKLNTDYSNMYQACEKNLKRKDVVPTGGCQLTFGFQLIDLINTVATCIPGLTEIVKTEETEIREAGAKFVAAFEDLEEEMSSYLGKFDWDETFYKKNFVVLNIHFSDLSRKLITQSHRYDIWALFCDIGGSMGLFLGASLLTFFEFFDILCIQCVKMAHAMKRKKQAGRTSGTSTPVTAISANASASHITLAEVLRGHTNSNTFSTPRVITSA